MNTTTEAIGISEQVLLFVTNSDKLELTCLDVSKGMNVQSGTNLILQTLAKKGLINERIERNGTRKYSAIKNEDTMYNHFSKETITKAQDMADYLVGIPELSSYVQAIVDLHSGDVLLLGSMNDCQLFIENNAITSIVYSWQIN